MEPDFLGNFHVAVVGLGLMGGSIALALQGRCAGILGIDPDPQALEYAKKTGFITSAATDPSEILFKADLIILAAPVGAILEILEQLPRLHPASPVVIDLGSTKTEIVAKMEALPGRFQAIGGHPICGKEKSSAVYAEAALFHEAPFILTPTRNTSDLAYQVAKQLVRITSARLMVLDAETHDRLMAATSHFPYLLANVLAGITPDEASPYIGPGFCSTSRLAGSSPRTMADILATNRDHVLSQIHLFQERLAFLERVIREGKNEILLEYLEEGMKQYSQLIGQHVRGK